eukprot:6260228-Heterocapsa_arctica.AAC.1
MDRGSELKRHYCEAEDRQNRTILEAQQNREVEAGKIRCDQIVVERDKGGYPGRADHYGPIHHGQRHDNQCCHGVQPEQPGGGQSSIQVVQEMR